MKLHLVTYLRILLIALLLVGSFKQSITAQKMVIRGSVVDSVTMEPVPFATLFINNETGTISDEQGNFTLSLLPGLLNDTIKFTSIGYASKSLPARLVANMKTIYLARNIYELKSVVVQATPQRIQKPEDIIQKAINNISVNYPSDPSLYKGYYREYVKDGAAYVNLFESMLNLEDPGIIKSNGIKANIEYKRLNTNFRVDTSLFRTYDNKEKFVPYSRVHTVHQNELVVLESTDPIKHTQGFSVSFIDNFREDFIKNHSFGKTRITYQDEVPYFVIDFEDNQGFILGNERLKATGTIYIDAEDYAIKKLHYLATLISGVKPKKLYELTVEYQKMDDLHFLKYISFNNLFKDEAFVLTSASYHEEGLYFVFNHPLDSLLASNPENIRVLYKENAQPVARLRVNDNMLYAYFSEDCELYNDLKSISSMALFGRNKKEEVIRDLDVEFNFIRDVHGNPLSNNQFEEYYQYREFFVQHVQEANTGLTSHLMDMSKPVFESEAVQTYTGDYEAMFNTPLINEDTGPLVFISNNSRLNKFLNQVSRLNETWPEELVYMQTDREVYAPQDTVWFKAYIRNKSNLTSSYLSQGFYAMLIDSTGKNIWEDRFIITEGDARGQFAIPNEVPEGYYHFIGYSSWMKNYSPEQVYHKKLLIQKEKPDALRLQIAFDKKEYLPGDSVSFVVSCLDAYNRQIDDVAFNVKIEGENRMLFIREGVTKAENDNTYTFLLPEQLSDVPQMEVKGRFKDVRMTEQLAVPVNYFVHVGFFPEGGQSLRGVNNTMAFKAVTRNGYPLHIEGEIADKKGRVQEKISSTHLGMGSFNIRYSNEDSMYLNITKPAAFEGIRFPLPQVRDSGWQLRAENKRDRILVELDNDGIGNDTSLVTVMVRDALVYYKPLYSKRDFRFFIKKENLPEGIAVITLFNRRLIPQAERLIFLHDAGKYNATIETDRKNYQPRDSVILTISLSDQIKNPERGSWSITIVDEPLCMSRQLNEPVLATSWLLSPEIRGSIHDPNSYLISKEKDDMENLDLLLLTQGWRKYEQFMTPPEMLPVNQDIISGVLFKQPFGQNPKPSEGEVSVFYGGQTSKLEVRDDGRFSFLPEYRPETNTGVFISATDSDDKAQINIELDRSPFDKELEAYVQKFTSEMNESRRKPVFTYNQFKEHFTYNLKYHEWIDEVVIRKKVDTKEFTTVDLATNKRSIPIEEIREFNSLEDVREYYSSYFNYSGNVFYVVDGRLQASTEFTSTMNPTTGEVISTSYLVPENSYVQGIFPEDIAEYTMVKGYDVTLYGLGELGDQEYTRMKQNENKAVVIDIKLKPLHERKTNRLWENKVVIPKFAEAKEFYKPLYDTEEKRESQIPDLRKTIHWEPDVKFTREGMATIRFYNGDRYTSVHCIVEGVDTRGIPVYGEYSYDVGLGD